MPFRVFCLLMPLGLLVGCGEKVPVEKAPPLAPVSGKVTMDGQPAPGVAVTFTPIGQTSGNGAYGSTDSEGNFKLQYRTGDAGVPPGDYAVVFSKLTQPDGSPIPEGQTAADVGALEQIPERYRQTEKPQFPVTVPEGGKTFEFALKSK